MYAASDARGTIRPGRRSFDQRVRRPPSRANRLSPNYRSGPPNSCIPNGRFSQNRSRVGARSHTYRKKHPNSPTNPMKPARYRAVPAFTGNSSLLRPEINKRPSEAPVLETCRLKLSRQARGGGNSLAEIRVNPLPNCAYDDLAHCATARLGPPSWRFPAISYNGSRENLFGERP